MVYYRPSPDGGFEFIVRDWKRSKKINKWGFGKWGKGPARELADCNWSHYCLQQNLYKFFLEEKCGVGVKDMAIVVFHSSNKTFQEHTIPDMSSVVNAMLLQRYEEVHGIPYDFIPGCEVETHPFIFL